MEMPLLSPSAVFGMARATVGWAVESAITVASVPGRVLGLLNAAESLMTRIDDVVNRADQLVGRTTVMVGEVETVIAQARTVAASADGVVVDAGKVASNASALVTSAGRTAHSANELVGIYQPLATRAAPLVRRFVEELSPHEVEAAIRLVDELPVLTEHLTSDILPILATLDRVGPEVHQLLEVAHDVRQAILGIPGFNFLRKRGEDKADGVPTN
jgi:hypothetical protein